MLIDAGKDAAADGSRTDARTNAPSSDSGSARSDAGTTTADSSRPPNPTTGTFPAVEDVGADGPFAARTVNNTGPGGGFTLYHPEELAPDGALNPIVAWGNGGFTTPDAYPMLPHLASHGFVVIASNNPFVGGADMRSGIEWVVEQNEDSSSDFYQKLDVDNIAGMGYSLGGLATYEIAADPRVVTIIIVSGGNVTDDRSLVATLHTPTAYFCTDDDASEGNCAGDYEAATVPTFFGVMNGSEHTDVADIFALGVQQIMDRMKLATTAWLRWQQMGDESLRAMFVGADCGLCEDPGWTVHPQKNGLM